MSEFKDIYLSWRKGPGHKRHIVGVIKNNINRASFEYLSAERLKSAEADGFTKYIEFPTIGVSYLENVLEIFKQRLFRSEREDYKDFLDFWGISVDKKDDTLYMLAHTQGLVPTDNFEFLAEFIVTKNMRFVSEICALTYTKVPSDQLAIGDKIYWKKAPSEYDEYQVDLYTKDGFLLGHVKKVHSRVFFDDLSSGIELTVKALDKNGFVKRAFIEIVNRS